MNFVIYTIGFVVFIVGLAWLAISLGASQPYIVVSVFVLVGLGTMSIVAHMRRHREDDGPHRPVIKK